MVLATTTTATTITRHWQKAATEKARERDQVVWDNDCAIVHWCWAVVVVVLDASKAAAAVALSLHSPLPQMINCHSEREGKKSNTIFISFTHLTSLFRADAHQSSIDWRKKQKKHKEERERCAILSYLIFYCKFYCVNVFLALTHLPFSHLFLMAHKTKMRESIKAK